MPRSGIAGSSGRTPPSVSGRPNRLIPERLYKFACSPAVQECLQGTVYSLPREGFFKNFMILSVPDFSTLGQGLSLVLVLFTLY